MEFNLSVENIPEVEDEIIKKYDPIFDAIISIKVTEDSSAAKEFIRALIYSGKLQDIGEFNKDDTKPQLAPLYGSKKEEYNITKILDVQKYIDYNDDMDKDEIDYRNEKGVLGFDIKNAQDIREFYDISSTISLDAFWNKLLRIKSIDVNKGHRSCGSFFTDSMFCMGSLDVGLSLDIYHTLFPLTTVTEHRNCSASSSVSKLVHTIVDGEDYYNLMINGRINMHTILNEIIKAYPDMEFYMVSKLNSRCSFKTDACFKKYDGYTTVYNKEELDNAQTPFIAHYKNEKLIKVDSTIIKDEECANISKTIMWNAFIFENDNARMCKNTKCQGIDVVNRYINQCEYCNKRTGFTTVKTGSDDLKKVFKPVYLIINNMIDYSDEEI